MSHAALDQAIRMLQGVPFFAGISREDLTPLAAACRLHAFRRGQVIFQREDPGDTLHIVQGGEVRIVLLSKRGDEIVLALFHPGDFFGELSLLDGLPRSATAVATEPTVTLTLGRPEFLRVLAESPQIARQVIGALAARLRHTNVLLGDAIFLGVAARVANRLLELARPQAEGDSPGARVVRITQTELAAMVGASRETVNKELRALETQGLVRLSRGQIVLLQPERIGSPVSW